MQPVGRDFFRFPVGESQAGMAQLGRGIREVSGEGDLIERIKLIRQSESRILR